MRTNARNEFWPAFHRVHKLSKVGVYDKKSWDELYGLLIDFDKDVEKQIFNLEEQLKK